MNNYQKMTFLLMLLLNPYQASASQRSISELGMEEAPPPPPPAELYEESEPQQGRSETPPPPPPAEEFEEEESFYPAPVPPVTGTIIPAPPAPQGGQAYKPLGITPPAPSWGGTAKAAAIQVPYEQEETPPPPPPSEEEEREENELDRLKNLVRKRLAEYENKFKQATKEFSDDGYRTFVDFFRRLNTSLRASSLGQMFQQLQDLYVPRYMSVENLKGATAKGKELWRQLKEDFETVIEQIPVKTAPLVPQIVSEQKPAQEQAAAFFKAVRANDVAHVAQLVSRVTPAEVTEGILLASRNQHPYIVVELLQHPYDPKAGLKDAPPGSTAFSRLNVQMREHMPKLFMQALENGHEDQIERYMEWPTISLKTIRAGIVKASEKDDTALLARLLELGQDQLTIVDIESALNQPFLSEHAIRALHEALQNAAAREEQEETITSPTQPTTNVKRGQKEIKRKAALRD